MNSRSPLLIAVATALLLSSTARLASAVDAAFWTLSPYRVRVLVAVDSRLLPSSRLASAVSAHLIERSDASIGALWDLSVEPLEGNERQAALRGFADDDLLRMAGVALPEAVNKEAVDDEQAASTIDDAQTALPDAEPDEPIEAVDKLIVLTVRESLAGFSAEAVECDPLLNRVGPTLRTRAVELHAASEAAFGLVVEAFSPVALFDVNRKTGLDATLSFRGSALPRKAGAPVESQVGDVLLPVLRRTNREGEVVEGGIQPVPWTFLQAIAAEASGSEASGASDGSNRRDEPAFRGLPAQVLSHSKRPFGVRRRGRVEQYALLLRPSDAPTRVRLHVRGNTDDPLPGYQAYVKGEKRGDWDLLGVSNADGFVTVPPGDEAVRMVYIKSGSQVVAKTPAPVGLVELIEVPLLDERARLRAEAKISLIREELIDLIARRSILAARIRNAIEAGDKANAQELLNLLDGMPGRAQFSLQLDRVQQQSKSDDAQVQQRIDRLFADTAVVLGAFLGTSEVEQLRRELNAMSR